MQETVPATFRLRRIALSIGALACAAIAFSLLVIRDFSGPLAGRGDVNIWEYMGFYVGRNLSFTPFPHLDLVNNQVFYPYGTNSVFQPWGFERDFFYAVMHSLFGNGPWLQLYFLGTVLVTAAGTFVLLRGDYGPARAGLTGMLMAFFNFYLVHKYPDHLHISVVHWTNLNIVADFLIVKRIVLREPVSLTLILVRLCLLMLSLGQDLGYIAGYALLSFTVSLGFLLLVFLYRLIRVKIQLTEASRDIVERYKQELKRHPGLIPALLGVAALVGFLYLPLAYQVAREAGHFDFTRVFSGAWWASPFRLLIPYLPVFNPGRSGWQQVFGDLPESLGAGSPGWFLLILGAMGLWGARKRLAVYVPLLVLFLLCLCNNPKLHPTLGIFPWFAFNRIADRATILYTAILALFALEAHLMGSSGSGRRFLLVLMICLGVTELCTAYSFKRDYRPYSFTSEFYAYMEALRKQPGEAVLDWPFCVSGGNGVGLKKLCPFFNSTAGLYALRRFHGKKVMGQYFGRLHPSQIQPYLEAGWDRLFLPNTIVAFSATRQRRCFRSDEWVFFTNFYRLNDFAGLNLYVDLLSERCVAEFYRRFGRPTAQTEVPGAGRVVFLLKPPGWRSQVNRALATGLRFQPSPGVSEPEPVEVPLLQSDLASPLIVTGLGDIEKDRQGEKVIWAFGPETWLSFYLAEPQASELAFRFVNPIAGQAVSVEINGTVQETIAPIRAGSVVARRIRFTAPRGQNNIYFRYRDWNGHRTTFAPADSRKLAVQFKELAFLVPH